MWRIKETKSKTMEEGGTAEKANKENEEEETRKEKERKEKRVENSIRTFS